MSSPFNRGSTTTNPEQSGFQNKQQPLEPSKPPVIASEHRVAMQNEPSSTATSSASSFHSKPPSQISNLTKNLMSSQVEREPEHGHHSQELHQHMNDQQQQQQQSHRNHLLLHEQEQAQLSQQIQGQQHQHSQHSIQNPQSSSDHMDSFTSSINSNQITDNNRNKFIPTPSNDGNSLNPLFPYQSSSYRGGAYNYSTPATDSINYIPSSHNTPTVVSTSYSSVHSYTPSLPNTNNFISQNSFQNQPSGQLSSSSYKPSGLIPHAIPTTTVSKDSVNSTSNRNSFASASSSFTPQNSFGNASLTQPTTSVSNQQQQQRFPSSFPANAGFGSAPNSFSHQNSNRGGTNSTSTVGPSIEGGAIGPTFLSNSSQNLQQAPQHLHPQQQHHQQQHQQMLQSQYIQPEPDHYMSYKEFLHNLSIRDGTNNDNSNNINSSANTGTANTNSTDTDALIYDGHLNIVDYPVNDLILMLSCLLTKIIEANDKLHPNHFDNTIAIRQGLKEEKRLKKVQKAKLKEERRIARREERERLRIASNSATSNHGSPSNSAQGGSKQLPTEGPTSVDVDVVDVGDEEEDNIEIDDNDDTNSHSNAIDIDSDEDDDEDVDIDSNDDEDDDEDDEMKNKYLANVLAFHGTNVPGISLHAYLARVLKYCPVTNEVFLSLLVYFDRIAKKANNLNQKKKTAQGSSTGGAISEETGAASSDAEQLFVMDSYNIHRLIISGITVSSKFFSDIFYKNLRYAKVGGLPLEELNYLELQFLLLLDFKLMISVEDLQNYGDLLLRFWKREQITNELVNNSGSTADVNSPASKKDAIKS
ncbi:uncharacterized protein RJT20DRAFT_133046 [Scheffersomyces xylosifermentans]|uniref:uncharacterized protein n=1 Tax=Scheffersomyces xylosifermentans TaxID=1304137 RepID=UPI00315DBCB0